MADMSLHVFTPYGDVLETHARAVRGRDASGCFGVRPGHEPLVTVLAPSILEVDPADGGATVRLAVDGGLFVCEGDRVRVATRDAVVGPGLERLTGALEESFARRRAEESGTRLALAKLETAMLHTLSASSLAAGGARRSAGG